MSEPYIPDHQPFHTEENFRVWQMREGHFLVCCDHNGQTYRGDLAGVARFIERERERARLRRSR